MKVYIGADHRGYDYKQKIIGLLQKLGHKVIDLGTYSSIQSCDYPDVAMDVGVHVSQDKDARGILICMSGIGQTIAANKVKGVYAALCYNLEAAELSRKHNNANVLVLSSKFVTDRELPQILDVWMTTPFEGGRHETRTAKIKQMEEQFGRAGSNDLYAFLPPLSVTETPAEPSPAKDAPVAEASAPAEEKSVEKSGTRRRRSRGGRRHSRSKAAAAENISASPVVSEAGPVAPAPAAEAATPAPDTQGDAGQTSSTEVKTARRPRGRSRGRRGRGTSRANKPDQKTDTPASA